MIFDTVLRQINEESAVFSTNSIRKYGYPHAKVWKWIITLYHIPKLSQNQLGKQVLNVLENIGGKFHDTGFGSDFLDMTHKAQATKITKLEKLDYQN